MNEVTHNLVNDLFDLSNLSNQIDLLDPVRVYEAEWVKHQNHLKNFLIGRQVKPLIKQWEYTQLEVNDH